VAPSGAAGCYTVRRMEHHADEGPRQQPRSVKRQASRESHAGRKESADLPLIRPVGAAARRSSSFVAAPEIEMLERAKPLMARPDVGEAARLKVRGALTNHPDDKISVGFCLSV
jgi:hypothetical protein